MESKIRRVIKRNGEEVSFDVNKILNAIRAANNEVEPIHKLNEYQIAAVGNILEKEIMSTSMLHQLKIFRIWLNVELWKCVAMKLHRSM